MSKIGYKDVSQYYVQTIEDLVKIIEFFNDKEFYTSKGESFKLWARCIKLIQEKKHLTKEGLLEICGLRDRMNSKLGGKNSRTTEIIEKFLENKPEHIEAHAKQTQLLHNGIRTDLPPWFEKRRGKKTRQQIEAETQQFEPEPIKHTRFSQ